MNIGDIGQLKIRGFKLRPNDNDLLIRTAPVLTDKMLNTNGRIFLRYSASWLYIWLINYFPP
jgi:hypothetical protein